jgi:hypothetical protein
MRDIDFIDVSTYLCWGMEKRRRLKTCSAIRKVTDSSLDEVIEFLFNLPNPSSLTKTRVYSASNRNEYQKTLLRAKARPAFKPDITAICEPIAWIMCDPQRLTTLWASTACYGDSFTFLHVDDVRTS